jgi:hypothetical protein
LLLTLRAAERLQPELGQLLGMDPVVVLKTLAQHRRETPPGADLRLNLLGRILLLRHHSRLPLDQFLNPAQRLPEENTACPKMRDLTDLRLPGRLKAQQIPQNTRIRRFVWNLPPLEYGHDLADSFTAAVRPSSRSSTTISK